MSKLYTQCGSFTKLFITVEVTKNPADCSPFTFETCVKTDALAESDQLQWETCICSVEGKRVITPFVGCGKRLTFDIHF